MSGQLVSFLVLSSVLLAPIAAQDRSAERFHVAVGLIQRSMHDDAARQLRRFVDDNPRHAKAAEACYRLGTCYLELKDPVKAIAALRRALKSGPFELRAECRYRLGHTLQETGDHLAAAEQFRLLVAEKGDGHYLAGPSSYAEGECLRKSGKDEPALAVYRKAAALDKSKNGQFAVSSLYQAGFIHLRRGEHTEAEKLFAAAADGFPKHPACGECRFLQGEAALRAGRHEPARGAFERALRSGGAFADDAAMGLGHCAVKQGQSAAAVQHFGNVIRRFPKSPLVSKAMLEAGRVLYKTGQHDAAVRQLDVLLARRPLSPDIRWPGFEVRALAALDAGRPKQAVADLIAAIKLASEPTDQGRMSYTLGEAYSDAGDWQKALAAYGRCQELTKDQALAGDCLYGQCLALHRLKRYEESNELVGGFRRKHRGHPLIVTVNFARAENLFALKDYTKADRAYGEVPSGHAFAAKASFKGAWCSYLAGDFKVAAKRFARIAAFGKSEHRALAEESLSMEALAWMESGSPVPALKAADRYRGKFQGGKFLARTERVAARVLKGQGKLKAAASRLSMAASVETSSERAFGDKLEYADLLFKQGDYAAAAKAYEPLVARSDKVGGRAHEGLAWCAFELSDDAACRSWIERGVKHKAIGTGRAALLELLSALHHRRKEWAAGESAAQRFLTEFGDHPRAPDVRYSLGVAQARGGKLKLARRTFESLREKKMPRTDRVFYELAWVCRRLKDETAALVAFRQVAALSKDKDLGGEACLQVGEAMLKGDSKKALAWLARVKGKYAARAQYLSGFTRFEQKEFEQALPHFDRIRKMGTAGEFYLEAQFFAGECLFQRGQHEAASKRYGDLLGRAADHQRAQVARLHQGQSLVLCKNPKQAGAVLREYLRRVGKNSPKSDIARANLWLGKSWKQDGEHARAEASFREVTDLTDSDLAAEAQFRIGECRRARGKTRDAADAFVKLSFLYGHAVWVQRGLNAAGDCYLDLEMPKKAAKLFEELVRRYPKAALAASAQTKLEKIRSN